MASYDELRKEPTVIKWLERINRKPKTEKSYLMALDKYIKFTGMTPTQLIEEAKRENREGVDPDDRAIQNRRYGFRKHLQNLKSERTNAKLKPLSIRSAMRGVQSFYTAFHLDAPKLHGGDIAESCTENTQTITREQIYEVLKHCTLVEKAIILVGCASGLAEADIINLKIEQFKKGYDAKTGFTTLEKLIRVKTKVQFTTFLTPEASQAVRDYLKFRNHEPIEKSEEILEKAAKQKITSEKGYLFIKQVIPKEYKVNYEPNEWADNEELRKYNEDAITHLFRRLAEKSGYINPDGWNIVRSHNSRKFFSLTLRNAGVHIDSDQIEHMMGHKKNQRGKAYIDFTTETLRATYELAAPYLTIDKSKQGIDIEKYEEVIVERDKLKSEVESASIERYELQEHQRKLEEQQREIRTLKAKQLWMQGELQRKTAALDERIGDDHIEEEEEKVQQAFEERSASRSDEDQLQEAAEDHIEEENVRNTKAYWTSRSEEERAEAALKNKLVEEEVARSEEELMMEAAEKHVEEEDEKIEREYLNLVGSGQYRKLKKPEKPEDDKKPDKKSTKGKKRSKGG